MTLTQITEKGIKDGEIINADINASAAIAGTKIDPSFTSNIYITNDAPKLFLTDGSNNPDFSIQNANGAFVIQDETASAVRLEVDGNGNVLTSGNLTVDGSSGDTILKNSGVEIQFTGSGVNYIGSSHASSSLQFYTANSPRLVIDNTGKIGINTTSPTGGLLHVTNSTGTIGYFESTQSASNVSNIKLNSTQTDSSANLELQINSGTTANGIIRLNGDNSIDLHNGATPTFKARLNSSGYLGLGTTSPGRLIHGYGTTPILKLEASNNEAYIQLTTLNQSNESYIGLVSGDIYMSTTGTGSSGNGERLRIKANGRVSINQGGPTGTLQVNDVNGDNVTLVLHTGATTNYIQLSDSVNAHTYIAKENSNSRSQVAFYASTSTGNGTGKVGHFDYRGLVLPAGKGISFSPHDDADTNPYGSDSNHLDDYERGSFQPAITSVNNPQPTQTAYVSQYGYYVKIGQMVHVRVDVEFSTSGVSGGTGEAVLSNLPFTSSSEQNAYGISMGVGYSPNWGSGSCPTGGYMNPNTTFIYLMPYNTNGATFSQAAQIGGGTRLIAGFTYMANS